MLHSIGTHILSFRGALETHVFEIKVRPNGRLSQEKDCMPEAVFSSWKLCLRTTSLMLSSV